MSPVKPPQGSFDFADASALRGWIRLHKQSLLAPGLFLLKGGLGVGKTHFLKWLLEDECEVSSPTFSLTHRYTFGDRQLAHWDLYRLTKAECMELSLWEDLQDMSLIVYVEWPERVEDEGWPSYVRRTTLELQCLLGEGRRLNIKTDEAWTQRLA